MDGFNIAMIIVFVGCILVLLALVVPMGLSELTDNERFIQAILKLAEALKNKKD